MTYAPIVSPTDFNDGAFAYMTRGVSAPHLLNVLTRASRSVESRCQRRFSPFVNLTESSTAAGVSMFGVGMDADLPLPMIGSLGMSKGRALGVTNLVQDMWLTEYAPSWPELWSYSNVSVTLQRTWGDRQTLIQSQLVGPELDTGHLRFPIGTLCPVGTTIVATYSGGYTTIPDDIQQAVAYTAAKTLIVEIEPQNRPGMDTNDLDMQIVELLCPYARA